MTLYDITPPITEYLRVWPGDTPPQREILLNMRRGDEITLSTLRSTVHLGAHADAPSHYGLDAPSIDARSLHYYLGPCQVIRVAVSRGELITPDRLRVPITAPRVLLATGTYPDSETFNEDFAALSGALVDWLPRAWRHPCRCGYAECRSVFLEGVAGAQDLSPMRHGDFGRAGAEGRAGRNLRVDRLAIAARRL